MNSIFKDRLELLLRILPVIDKEHCFAVHGGTAINLFVNDMPRYSVDIDLTYIPLEGRNESLENIKESLKKISEGIKRSIPNVNIVVHLDVCKIICFYHDRYVKIEVNKTKRGIVGGDVKRIPLCPKAQKIFGLYMETNLVPITQLYGGKIAAALSRQHPRDLFDISRMSISLQEAKLGFMFCLLGSDRPLYETFAPKLIDQKQAMINQFAGMTDEPFKYSDYELARKDLIKGINNLMNDEDKKFLIKFENATPEWDTSPSKDLIPYPSVQWKLQNLRILPNNNPEKLDENVEKLIRIFFPAIYSNTP